MLIALALASVLIPSSEEVSDPDGIVTTAPRGAGAVMVGAEAPTTDARPDASQIVTGTPQTLTTREQIDRWVSARSSESVPFADARGPLDDDRKMHGFVSGAIGTNDYSSVAVGVSLPVGENGRVDLSYSQTKNGWGYPGYGDGAGYPGEYGYGARVRPFGGYNSFYGEPAGRSRSMSLGLRWDQDRDRGEDQRLRALGYDVD